MIVRPNHEVVLGPRMVPFAFGHVVVAYGILPGIAADFEYRDVNLGELALVGSHRLPIRIVRWMFQLALSDGVRLSVYNVYISVGPPRDEPSFGKPVPAFDVVIEIVVQVAIVSDVEVPGIVLVKEDVVLHR